MAGFSFISFGFEFGSHVLEIHSQEEGFLGFRFEHFKSLSLSFFAHVLFRVRY